MDSLLMPYKGQLALPIYLWIVYVVLVAIYDMIVHQDFRKYNLLNNNIFLNHDIYYPFRTLITLFEDKTIFEGMENAEVIEGLMNNITEKYYKKCSVLAKDYINFLKPEELDKSAEDLNIGDYVRKLEEILLPPDVFDENGNKIEDKKNVIENACSLYTKELDIFPSDKSHLVLFKMVLKTFGLQYVSGKFKCRFKFTIRGFLQVLIFIFAIVFIIYIIYHRYYIKKGVDSNTISNGLKGFNFGGLLRISSMIVFYVILTKVCFEFIIYAFPRLVNSLKYKLFVSRGVDVLNLLNFHVKGGDDFYNPTINDDTDIDEGIELGDNLGDNISDNLGGKVGDNISDKVGDNLGGEVGNNIGKDGDKVVEDNNTNIKGPTNKGMGWKGMLGLEKKKPKEKREKTIKEKYECIFNKNIKWMMFILKFNKKEKSIKDAGEHINENEDGFRRQFKSFLLEPSDQIVSPDFAASSDFLKKQYTSGIKSILVFESDNISKIDASEKYNIADKKVSIMAVLFFNLFSKPGCVDRMISAIILLYIFHISIKTSNTILERKSEKYKKNLVVYLNLFILISIAITLCYVIIIILIKTFSIYICFNARKIKIVSAFLEKNIIHSEGIIISSSSIYRLFDKKIISKKKKVSFLGIVSDVVFILLVLYFIVYIFLLIFVAEKSHTYKKLYKDEKKVFREHYSGVCQILIFLVLICYFIYISVFG